MTCVWHDDRVDPRRRTLASRRGGTRRLATIALLLLLVAPWMVGCVRVKASITISPDDTVSGQIIAAAKPRNDADLGPQLNADLPFGRKVAVSKYNRDGYVGSQAVFSDLTFGELPQLAGMNPDAAGMNLTLRRSGDLVILEGRVDLTGLQDSEAPGASEADIRLTVTFPGEVVSTDGKRLTAEMVEWNPAPGVVSTMSAQARYTDPSTRSFIRAATWLGLGAFAVAALVALLAWQVRDRSPAVGAPVDEEG
ncbi:protein LppM [Mycolicibacillus koreensis]|uniref:DUF3153 domain-containing protein n=1 Tax=Mycolicibacillus koreensis TaxID=1069220 RepID=A0A7I7S9E3_9MYCO|nr:DUF3153 domain-containing protein [Mycolicibacillus koreensis]BBY53303.1 protein LppM [Mycolicibacillus koreensis]